VRGAWLTGLMLMAVACSSGAVEAEDTAAPAALPSSDDATASPKGPEEGRPMRVLVTGFNDWEGLGDPPNTWRCRDNPSCRLLLGAEHDAAPQTHEGPLVVRLRRRAPDIEWSFKTMPVTWDAFATVPDDVDVIVNIGLGVYHRFDSLQLEAGAFNLRQGTDAAGHERSEAIAAGAPEILPAPEHSSVPTRLASVAGRTMAGYEIVVMTARDDNTYLCNETHYHALQALHAGHGALREVYFLHIPYAENGDYEALAEGVAALVLSLAGR
jgi:pyrrolidone-carboxylate peptidase